MLDGQIGNGIAQTGQRAVERAKGGQAGERESVSGACGVDVMGQRVAATGIRIDRPEARHVPNQGVAFTIDRQFCCCALERNGCVDDVVRVRGRRGDTIAVRTAMIDAYACLCSPGSDWRVNDDVALRV